MQGNKSQQVFGNTRFVDTAWSQLAHVPSDNTRVPFFIVLNPTRQGNGISNRSGDRINMLSVRLKGNVQFQYKEPAEGGDPPDPPVAVRDGNMFRYLIVYDCQPLRDDPENTSLETHFYPEILNALFADGSSPSLLNAPFELQANLAQLSRYTILADETISFNQPRANAEYLAGTEHYTAIDRYVKLPPECREATYDTNPAIPGWNPDLPIRGRLLIVFKAVTYIAAGVMEDFNAVRFHGMTRVAFQ